MSADPRRLPFEPLARYCAARDGRVLPEKGKPVGGNQTTDGDKWATDSWLGEYLGGHHGSTVNGWWKRGLMLDIAEAVCMELGVHPAQIWGGTDYCRVVMSWVPLSKSEKQARRRAADRERKKNRPSRAKVAVA